MDKHLVSLTAPASFAAEQYQGLRLTIERLARTREVRVIAVSSPAAADGKTVTAINLAGALARGSDARVLIIDADLRRPSIASLFDIPSKARGLADVLTDATLPLAAVVQPVNGGNLSAIPAGIPRRRIGDILRSDRLEALLAEARRQYAYIVVDTPPLLPVFDSALLAKSVDGLLMVIAANRTPRKLLGEALNMVEPAKILGIVLNRDERPLFGYYNSYYREYFPERSQLPSEA